MRLTHFTDYSLRVLMYVAAHGEGRSTIGDVARAFDISANHLTKVVHFLGKRGFLANVRGRGGGLALARPASAINVATVVREAEGAIVPAECFDAAGGGCALASVCRLRSVLNDAVQAFYAVLAQYTLEDLVGERSALAKLLFAPSST
ncbi:MAG TPA: Rrf2 family transcriptional regulator [Casimicrobiaceae bacterium]|nr:Rrf2 family transcriptional regulator [Casimicrobiaceae bacterium]